MTKGQNMNMTEVESNSAFGKPADCISETRAEDIIRYGVITVEPETPVYQAVATLVEKNITGLPVVKKDMSLSGIISEKDVLKLLYESHRGAGVVGEFMTENVISFDIGDSLDNICDCLANNVFRRVTILDRDRLTSVISRSDIIRVNKSRFRPSGLSEDSPKDPLLAKNIMKCGLITVKRETPIFRVMELLVENNITGIPVIDGDMNLEGIVSEKDILRLVYDPNSRPGTVEDIMTDSVVSFDKDDNLFDICDCLINNHFRRVTILDKGKLVGIVSRADIIVSILRHNASLFRHRNSDRESS
jgi:CBS domain-containing protein